MNVLVCPHAVDAHAATSPRASSIFAMLSLEGANPCAGQFRSDSVSGGNWERAKADNQRRVLSQIIEAMPSLHLTYELLGNEILGLIHESVMVMYRPPPPSVRPRTPWPIQSSPSQRSGLSVLYLRNDRACSSSTEAEGQNGRSAS